MSPGEHVVPEDAGLTVFCNLKTHVCGHLHDTTCLWSQGNTVGSVLSICLLCGFWGIELRLSGLCGQHFTCWSILLVPTNYFLIQLEKGERGTEKVVEAEKERRQKEKRPAGIHGERGGNGRGRKGPHSLI